MKYLWLCVFFLMNLSADKITVFNQTDEPMYVAHYYVNPTEKGEANVAERRGDIVVIPHGSFVDIERPARKCARQKKLLGKKICLNYVDREFFFSTDKKALASHLSKSEIQSLKHHNVADKNLGFVKKLYAKITPRGTLAINTEAEMKALPVKEAALYVSDKTLDLLGKPIRKAFDNSPYAKKTAQVDARKDGLCKEEEEYIAKRIPQVKKALATFLGVDENKITDQNLPRIAFCCSGGGYRAQSATLGDFMGAKRIGLLESVLYTVGLSGSTWAMAGWITSGMDIAAYRDHLATRLEKDLFHGDINNTQVANALLRKKVFGEPVSLIDIYGALLGQKILAGLGGQSNPNKIYLNEQERIIKNGNYPFPLYTAIIAHDRSIDPYAWVEFSPYEVGSTYLQAWVPTWSLGQRFKAGKSLFGAPPLPLGYLMGIWGSAFSANLKSMLEEYEKKLPSGMATLLKKALSVETIRDTRVSPAHVWNPTYKFEGHNLREKKKLTLVDAGLDFNNPLPPLMRPERKIDIIIVFDQSATIAGSPEMKKAEEFFKKNNIPFPPIDYSKTTKTCSVHRDLDGKAPTVIYMPRVGDDMNLADYKDIVKMRRGWKFTQTSNFAYTPEEVKKLSDLTKSNVVNSKEIIVDAIREVFEQKSK